MEYFITINLVNKSKKKCMFFILAIVYYESLSNLLKLRIMVTRFHDVVGIPSNSSIYRLSLLRETSL